MRLIGVGEFDLQTNSNHRLETTPLTDTHILGPLNKNSRAHARTDDRSERAIHTLTHASAHPPRGPCETSYLGASKGT